MLKKFGDYKVNENLGSGRKALYVDGGDYAVLSFEDVHRGTKVIDIINNPQDYQPAQDAEGYWELSVYEFGEIDPKFIDFIRSKEDYDTSKHETFFMDDQTLGEN